MIYTGGGSFFLDDAALAHSPSRADGVDAETEFKLRLYGAELIQEGGILLKLCVSACARCVRCCVCVFAAACV
jgi:hypothetical protein